MQPDVITLAVDEENDGVGLVNHVYSRFDEYQNRTTYIGADHSLQSRNTLGLYRTLPKSNGNFRGVAKSAVKFSQDITVDGLDGVSQITAPIIVEVSVSLPVGATPADALIARQRVVALVDRDDIMTPLMEQLMI
jgi:hypothetical protein